MVLWAVVATRASTLGSAGFDVLVAGGSHAMSTCILQSSVIRISIVCSFLFLQLMLSACLVKMEAAAYSKSCDGWC